MEFLNNINNSYKNKYIEKDEDEFSKSFILEDNNLIIPEGIKLISTLPQSFPSPLDLQNENNLSSIYLLNLPLKNDYLSVYEIHQDPQNKNEDSFENKINDNNISLEEPKYEEEIQLNSSPIFFNFDKIKNEILPYLNLTQNSKKKLISDKNILVNIEQNSDNFDLLNKKISSFNIINIVKIDKKYRAGRKNKDDKTFRIHNNYSDDNIIKKIKTYIFEYALSFLNQILNLYIDKETKKSLIKKTKKNKGNVSEQGNLLNSLDYKIIKRLKRDIDLKFLETPLKKVFYNDISGRFSTFKKESNKLVIDEIMEKEKGNEIIMYAFNMKLEEWFDFFCYKKEIKFLENIEKEKDIKFERADIILNEIAEKNDDAYFTKFIFYFYNYKRWFLYKKGRKRNQ